MVCGGAFLAIAGAGSLFIFPTRPSRTAILYPGLAAMAVFVLFPLLYTAQIGFTNYSSAHF